jgi:hypothetical protein
MSDHTDDRRSADPASTTAPRRKPYQSPKLVVYGNLSRLVAMAKPGTRGDGAGNPKTKT